MLFGAYASAVLPGIANAQAAGRAARLISAARAQIGVTVQYDPAYSRIAYPNGDVPRVKGVCTDVIVRAYRDAFRIDLQALVHADMRAAFDAYPKSWGLSRPDSNIDHRRVPNLRTWLTRRRANLPVPRNVREWRAGDIFTSLVGNRPHIGLVSDRRGPNSLLVIHNVGRGTREEDVLLVWPITGRYRWNVD